MTSGTMTRLTMWLQAEAPDAELQSVHAMKVTAWAEARPGLVLLTHADVNVLQRQFHTLRGQGQQPVLQLRQHALCRSGCTVSTMSVSWRSVLPMHGQVISCGVQPRDKPPQLIVDTPWPAPNELGSDTGRTLHCALSGRSRFSKRQVVVQGRTTGALSAALLLQEVCLPQ